MPDTHRSIERTRAFGRRTGFTLIEIVIAITILATVLTMSYTILSKVLETEKEVSKRATPEKIGNGIMTAIRRDLMSTFYQGLGPEVFTGRSEGEGKTANDEVSFFTTVPPLNPETLGGQFDDFNNPDLGTVDQGALFTGVTAITYYLQETQNANQDNIFTLFRKESIDIGENPPFFPTSGISYELYDKMIAIDIDYLDGYDYTWVIDWSSRDRLDAEKQYQEEEAELALEDGSAPQTAITSGANADKNSSKDDGRRKTINARTREIEDAEALNVAKEDFYDALRPPVAIPMAVRVEITFLAGDEKGAYEKETRTMSPELQYYTFSTVVPLLAGMRVPLISEEEFLEEQGLGDDLTEGFDELDPDSGGTRNKP